MNATFDQRGIVYFIVRLSFTLTHVIEMIEILYRVVLAIQSRKSNKDFEYTVSKNPHLNKFMHLFELKKSQASVIWKRFERYVLLPRRMDKGKE